MSTVYILFYFFLTLYCVKNIIRITKTTCQVKLASCKVLVLLFGTLWFILRGNLLYVLPCAILFLCFSVLLTLRLPRLGKRELIFVLFVFVLVWICRFPLPLDVWEGLRFVIVALPGLFSYLFCTIMQIMYHILWDHWVHCGIFENRFLLRYTLESVSSVANILLLM